MSQSNPLARIVVVDIETSGLDPYKCSVLQIGAVWLGAAPLNCEDVFFADARHEWWHEWEAGAAKVHGLSRAEASDIHRPSEAVALEDLLDWLEFLPVPGRLILAGMNPAFDLSFLRRAARDSDQTPRLEGLLSHRTLDMHTLALAKCVAEGEDPDGLHTDAIYEMLGMKREPRPHEALTGARMEGQAIRRLLSRETK